MARQNAQQGELPMQVMTSAVLAVIMRVDGEVPTRVSGHAVGTLDQQVIVRIGDALLYLREAEVAGYLRRQWDGA